MLKGSKIYSIVRHKCPRCQEGDLYKSSIFGGIYNMNKNCPKCGQDFEIEPGFYWGAMYVGYILSVFYMLGGFAICLWVFKMSTNASFTWLIILGFLILPIIARTARAIWINTNVRYNKRIAESVKDK